MSSQRSRGGTSIPASVVAELQPVPANTKTGSLGLRMPGYFMPWGSKQVKVYVTVTVEVQLANSAWIASTDTDPRGPTMPTTPKPKL